MRALLIGAHVLSVVVLALPSPRRLADQNIWRSRVNVDEIAAWAKVARSVGIPWSAQDLEGRLYALTIRYLDLRGRIIAPFEAYSVATGLSQGWRMFTNPQRHPARLQVEIREPAGDFRYVFIARSDEYQWRRYQFDQNRMRKQLGRFARSVNRTQYRELSLWIARQLAHDFPRAVQARVSLYRFRSRNAEQVRAGVEPEGHFEDIRLFDLEPLR